MQKDTITAAFVMIGDEILSGRTTDKNLNFLAKNLTATAIHLKAVKVVPDDESEIISAIHEFAPKYDYIFTSGGIGPTHDDITAASIAKAFNTELELNQEAEKILHQFYGVEINEARLKMAQIPVGATLLDNPVSSAPGFRLKNTFVMAGVPKIFQAMFFAAQKELVGGKKIIAKEVKLKLYESQIAKPFAATQKNYPKIAMGSYPHETGTSLVFRGIDAVQLEAACDEMLKKVREIDENGVI